MDWRTEACRVIKDFDDALGRPPFPIDAPDDLVGKAKAVQETLMSVVAAGKLKSLDGVSEVTTTLPVLCASLREGTPNHTPCLRLYRPLLLAAAHASSLSLYPISYLLRDAEEVLGVQKSSSPADSRMPHTAAGASTVESSEHDRNDAEVENEVTLFTVLLLTRTLTPAHMRRFLRMPAFDSSATGCSSKRASGKGGLKSIRDVMHVDDSGESRCRGTAVPRALMHSMLEAPLSEECRAVFESFVDNTPKFLACVAGDGDFARRILDVYAARIIPKLKPSSLLSCLDAPLLDYYVDIVAASQRTGHSTLLSSPEIREVALRAWDAARLCRLSSAAVSRPIGAEDAMASLVVYVFLYRIYCDLSEGEAPTVAESSSGATANVEASVSVIEAQLIAAVCKASKTVLLADRTSSSCASLSSAYLQSKTGVLLVEGSVVPPALEPLEAFGHLLLSRRAAVALWRKELWHLLEKESECAKVARTAASASAALLETSVVSVVEGALRSSPRPDPGTRSTSRPHDESASGRAAKSKRKHKSASSHIGKGSQAHATSGLPDSRQQQGDGDTPEAPPAPVPFSELLSGCCICLLLAELLRSGAEAPDAEGVNSEHTADYQYGRVLDCAVRAYAYLLQYQSQRLKAALWYNFRTFLTCQVWEWAKLVSSSDNEDCPTKYLPFMQRLLSAPSSLTVWTALTTDTASMWWLSPLLLPAYLSASCIPSAAAEMLSQVLWRRPCHALWMAVLRAAAHGESVVGGAAASRHMAKASSPLQEHLHPVSATFLLGVLCSQWSDAVFADVAECVAAGAAGGGDGGVLMASLIRMRTSEACANEGTVPLACDVALECVSASLSQQGLQRLLDKVEALQAEHIATSNLERQEAREEGLKRVQEQLQESRALSEAHRAFWETAQAQRAERMAEQQHVQVELQRRRAARDTRLRDEAAALERKRQIALETLRRKAVQTRAEADAARQRRFSSYQRRLQSEYRVSTFLEHLQLSSARVIEAREALRTIIDNITPDDLLEYIVSGTAKVPADMLGEEDDADAVDGVRAIGAALGKGSAAGAGFQAARQAPGLASPDHQATGQRRDFWEDVMGDTRTHGRTFPQGGDESIDRRMLDIAPESAGSTGAAASHQRSFHARIAPLMDLFCYEDGDEFGRVPDVLPVLRLRMASRVWPSPQVQSLGFADVHEAFERMRDRGLVRIRGDVAQLTLLGFRYHYPFHNPEGMLEVHLREARDRVRALVKAQREWLRGRNASNEASEGDSDIVEEEDEEASAPRSPDRLLPELEFGI
ncbi:hypothetical protein LSCM1_03848 [Leishmania martiniquensis]|uniref:Uncharacterized protein n=1 Tax=Leishmania martiniquensis TaxID=1580590 RepID=A0A836GHV3_9TRYP|nr:hypothetical protein LSCM1_03848 [Leishmania martiniquensis]